MRVSLLHTITTFFFCLVISSSAHGQLEFGLRGGISSYDVAKSGLSILQGDQTLRWVAENAGFGHHGGVYSRLTLWAVYLEPALVFHSHSMQYRLEQYTDNQLISETIKKATYRHLDVPVLLGLKMGFFRLQGGPVGHFFINQLSDLTKISTFGQKLNDATFSYMAGVGVDLWRFRVDLNYEGRLHSFGESIVIDGQSIQFSEKPARVLLSLGFKL